MGGPHRGRTYRVELKRARNLRDLDSELFQRGHSDPFCRFGVVSDASSSKWENEALVQDTAVCKDTANPEWNHVGYIPEISTSATLWLRMEVYDWDRAMMSKGEVRDKDRLGFCVVPMMAFSGWVPLQPFEAENTAIELKIDEVEEREDSLDMRQCVRGFDPAQQPGELFLRSSILMEVNLLSGPSWNNPRVELETLGQKLSSENLTIRPHGLLGFGQFRFFVYQVGSLPSVTVTFRWGSPPLSRRSSKKKMEFSKSLDLCERMDIPELKVEVELRAWAAPLPIRPSSTKPFRDVTSRFRDRFNHAIRRREEKNWREFMETPEFIAIQSTVLMFVGGLFTDHYPGYYTQNLEHVRENLQLEAEVIDIHTESSVRDNAETVYQAVVQRHRRVPEKKQILIGHSKGGVDIAAAMSLYPELKEYVAGVVTMQAPFWGTYMADWVRNQPGMSSTLRNVIERVWGGEDACVQDLGYNARSAFVLASHYGEDIPTVSVGSYADYSLGGIDSFSDATGIGLMKVGADIVEKETGCRCDGLVAQMDAILPGADAVLLDDMMHTEPALFVPGSKYPPGPLTETLLTLLAEKLLEI